MKTPGIYLQVIALLLMIATGCDSNRVFDEYKEIPDASWHKDSAIAFKIPVTDKLQLHNLLIQLRNETSYRFSNIWLFIEITQPDGHTSGDTLEVILADPAGRWLGTGFGGIKTRQAMYQRNVRFPMSGEFEVTIRQGMREENLRGIHDVGFRVERIPE